MPDTKEVSTKRLSISIALGGNSGTGRTRRGEKKTYDLNPVPLLADKETQQLIGR